MLQSPPERSALWQRAVTVRSLPALVLVILGSVQLLHDPPLWYDEAYTKLAAGVPVSTLLGGMWHRVGVIDYLMDVPPSFNGPYYLLMHYWCAVFGTGDIALRLPSLVFSAGAVAVMAELGRRLAGPVAGLATGLLCATSPLLVTQAVQARDYGIAMLAVALCALWLEQWRRTGRGKGKIGAVAACAGLMHWFTLPVIAAFGVFALLQRRTTGSRRMALVLASACLPASLLVVWSLLGGTYGAPTPPAVGAWLPVRAIWDWAGESSVLAVGLALAALLGAVRKPHRALLLCWVLIPLALITAVELARPSYFSRYLLFTLLGLALAAGVGLAMIRSRWLRAVMIATLVGLSTFTTWPLLSGAAQEPSPAAVKLLAAAQRPGEPIVPADGRTSLDLKTYLALEPRLGQDLVLPPVRFTSQTSSHTVWLVRVVLKVNSLPVVPAEQRLSDAGWAEQGSRLLIGTTTDLRVEKWTR